MATPNKHGWTSTWDSMYLRFGGIDGWIGWVFGGFLGWIGVLLSFTVTSLGVQGASGGEAIVVGTIGGLIFFGSLLLMIGSALGRRLSIIGLHKLNKGWVKFNVGDRLRVRRDLLDNYYLWFLGSEDEVSPEWVRKAAALKKGCRVHKVERNEFGNFYRLITKEGKDKGPNIYPRKSDYWVRVPEFMVEKVKDE